MLLAFAKSGEIHTDIAVLVIRFDIVFVILKEGDYKADGIRIIVFLGRCEGGIGVGCRYRGFWFCGWSETRRDYSGSGRYFFGCRGR